MKDLYLIGAGGFSTEIMHLVEMIQEQDRKWKNLYFIDDNRELHAKQVRKYKVKGGLDCIKDIDDGSDVVITINNPVVRRKIVEILKANNNITFPNLISPYAIIDFEYLNMGVGNIVMHSVVLSTHVTIGNFNSFNSYTGIGHDAVIGDYNSFGPRVAISGAVKIGDMNDFGLNSSVLQYKTIGDSNEIWMSTAITKNLKSGGKYFGVPAKKIQL